MRTKIVAGNWKMNKNLQETEALLSELSAMLPDSNAEVIVAPTFVNLQAATNALQSSTMKVAAQNMHFAESGAYTGEISADMLLSLGVDIVILGHSERRAYFGEDDELLSKKVKTAVEKGLKTIFCFGEELEDRKSGNHFSVVESQLKNALFDLDASAWKSIILAYEPVWAIGTGKTASPEQAEEVHSDLRKMVEKQYTFQIAQQVRIQYGGSVKPGNAAELLSQPNIDGALVGGASLKVDDFIAIVDAGK